MCGRYVTPTEKELNAYWSQIPLTVYDPPEGITIDSPFAQRFNVAPTTAVPVGFVENGVPVIRTARWGIVPIW